MWTCHDNVLYRIVYWVLLVIRPRLYTIPCQQFSGAGRQDSCNTGSTDLLWLLRRYLVLSGAFRADLIYADIHSRGGSRITTLSYPRHDDISRASAPRYRVPQMQWQLISGGNTIALLCCGLGVMLSLFRRGRPRVLTGGGR